MTEPTPSTASSSPPSSDRWVRVLVTLVVLVALAAVFVLAADVIWILFLGLIFGVFLSRLSELLAGTWPLDRSKSLVVVVTLLLVLIFGSMTMFFVQINKQVASVSRNLDEGIAKLNELAAEYPTLATTVGSIPGVSEAIQQVRQNASLSEDEGQDETGASSSGHERSTDENDADGNRPNESARDPAAAGDAAPSQGDGGASGNGDANAAEDDSPLAKATSSTKTNSENASISQGMPGKLAATVGRWFQSAFGMVVNLLIIFFVGLYFAISPGVYKRGVEKLVAMRHRARAREVLNTLGYTLWRWLIGRLVTMLITGTGAFLVLWIAGVPMAATAGALTGLLSFVPNIGAAVALLLAVLLALPQGMGTVFGVTVGYMALQLIESYVITPLIQQHQVAVHPALLLAAQAIMAALFGFLGAVVASPVMAALLVLVKMLYIRDYLGDPEISVAKEG